MKTRVVFYTSLGVHLTDWMPGSQEDIQGQIAKQLQEQAAFYFLSKSGTQMMIPGNILLNSIWEFETQVEKEEQKKKFQLLTFPQNGRVG